MLLAVSMNDVLNKLEILDALKQSNQGLSVLFALLYEESIDEAASLLIETLMPSL